MSLEMDGAAGRFVMVGGVRTHYLEAGEGPTVVLLHSGEFGGAAEISWEHNIGALAEHFHVLAPDFVGFGRSDKLRDFTGHGRRMLEHISRFLEVMCIDEADFVGNSVSGRFLCRVASQETPIWPIRRMVVASGGGFEPDNEARRILQDYDATIESMRGILRVLFHDPAWAENDEYLRWRYEFSTMPGAWEVAAAARFKSPAVPPRPQFGRPDLTEYERIRVPTLFVAGADDPLLEPEYWVALAERTPSGRALAFEQCGHCPHIEYAEEFNEAVIAFFTETDTESAERVMPS